MFEPAKYSYVPGSRGSPAAESPHPAPGRRPAPHPRGAGARRGHPHHQQVKAGRRGRAASSSNMAALLPLRVHVGTLVLLSSSATVLATPIQDCEAWARSMYFSVLCQVGDVRRLARRPRAAPALARC